MKKYNKKSKWEKMMGQIGPEFQRREAEALKDTSPSAYDRLRDQLKARHPHDSDERLEERFQNLLIRMKERNTSLAQKNLEKEQARRNKLLKLAQTTPPKNPPTGK